jgi:23S rRNA pseudouridine2604 synthase
MHIPLDLETGKWRHLTPDELQTIDQLVENSAKTHD